MSRSSGKKKIIRLILLILILAAIALAGYMVLHLKQSSTQAQQILDAMEGLIPGLDLNASDPGVENDDGTIGPADGTDDGGGGDSTSMAGVGRDPLAALSIEGVDIVGCLQIPSIDLTAPVAAKDVELEYCATWVSGSPVQGNFRLTGGHEDVFLKLAKAKPGARVIFTDIDGVRYEYEVTTQYHLKDWAEADNDLLLCYPSDSQTDFVVGCTSLL